MYGSCTPRAMEVAAPTRLDPGMKTANGAMFFELHSRSDPSWYESDSALPQTL